MLKVIVPVLSGRDVALDVGNGGGIEENVLSETNTPEDGALCAVEFESGNGIELDDPCGVAKLEIEPELEISDIVVVKVKEALVLVKGPAEELMNGLVTDVAFPDVRRDVTEREGPAVLVSKDVVLVYGAVVLGVEVGKGLLVNELCSDMLEATVSDSLGEFVKIMLVDVLIVKFTAVVVLTPVVVLSDVEVTTVVSLMGIVKLEVVDISVLVE